MSAYLLDAGALHADSVIQLFEYLGQREAHPADRADAERVVHLGEHCVNLLLSLALLRRRQLPQRRPSETHTQTSSHTDQLTH